jgi:hypothetical protein
MCASVVMVVRLIGRRGLDGVEASCYKQYRALETFSSRREQNKNIPI